MATTVVLTNAGRAILTNRIIGAGTTPSYVGWGTGAGTAAAADTALVTEDVTGGYARINGTTSRVTTSQTNDTYQVVATITALASLTITEAGVFDAVAAGNMLIHGTFTGIALSTSDSITFTVKLQFS